MGYLGAGDESSVSIPWGIGVKFNLYRQWSCGGEWSTRKLFTDKIDQVYDLRGAEETDFVIKIVFLREELRYLIVFH